MAEEPGGASAIVTIVSAPELPPPFPLPDAVRAGLLRLAQDSDVLVIGELHGTREIPHLVASLLPDLFALGYRGLAHELPSDMRPELAMWAADPSRTLPRFFTTPSSDGRGNADFLGLVLAAAKGWQILCFDMAPDEPYTGWVDRDARMAAHLTAQRREFCPGGKVIAICGNMHSRIQRTMSPGDPRYDLWPSFAGGLAERNPYLSVGSVDLNAYTGTFYNSYLRTLSADNAPPEIYLESDTRTGHTAILHLPRCNAPSFLAPPKSDPPPV